MIGVGDDFTDLPEPLNDPDTGYESKADLDLLPALDCERVSLAIQSALQGMGGGPQSPDEEIKFGDDVDDPSNDNYPEPDDIYGPPGS